MAIPLQFFAVVLFMHLSEERQQLPLLHVSDDMLPTSTCLRFKCE